MKIKLTNHWPCAQYRNGVIEDKLFTYDPVDSIESARNVISTWAQDFHLLHAWIESEYIVEDSGRTGTRTMKLF